jgi:3-oxoacyl-[acyl-carrier protein] reductase
MCNAVSGYPDSAIEQHYHALIPRYPELKGQVAVVTGGAKGIGQGIVLRLAREGMRVVIGDIDQESLASTASVLHNLGATVLAVHGDLSQPDDIRRLFEQTAQAFASAHLLVNNAADLTRTRLLDPHEDLLDRQLATNVRGPYLCSYHAARFMSASHGGSIVHISSVGALRSHWIGLPYDVTKGAINAMTRAMAIDLAEHNIRVNAVGPGAVHKQNLASPEVHEMAAVAARIPLQRLGLISEISSLVAFLASPDAGYITGQVIYVDGGITAQLSPPGQPL